MKINKPAANNSGLIRIRLTNRYYKQVKLNLSEIQWNKKKE